MAGPQETLRESSFLAIREEAEFYEQYAWSVNAFPRVMDILDHLSNELSKVGKVCGWAESEVLLNIFLLTCSITDTLDDFLAGSVYDLSKARKFLPAIGSVIKAGEATLNATRIFRRLSYSSLRRWRMEWADAVTDFLQHAIVPQVPVRADVLKNKDRLANLLQRRLPQAFGEKLPRIPAFFRSRDFTAADCLELGRKFASTVADRSRPVVIMGLRTAGSFLAPLLCAYLRGQHFSNVRWVAIRPKKGTEKWEQTVLEKGAKERGHAIIVDESIHSGQTLLRAMELLERAGFKQEDVFVLNPAEPALPNWRHSLALESLPRLTVIDLEPAERSKCKLLDSSVVVERLAEYYRARGYSKIVVRSSPATEARNKMWRMRTPEKVDARLKRLYELELQGLDGNREIRHVLAKSIGSGWLSYHAFLIAERLSDFLPPTLGLRDGILYTEWLPQSSSDGRLEVERSSLAEKLGAYVGTRARELALRDNPTPTLAREGRHNGFQMLAYSLSRAYNSRLARIAQQRRLPRELARQSFPTAVLTDSKMSTDEWVCVDSRMLKADFEHHGQGKNELLMTDPAFDLAGGIFFFNLNEQETARMIRAYIERSGDHDVQSRLYFNKLVVGLWAKNRAATALHHPLLIESRNEFGRQFASARNFLVEETIRECGKLSPVVGRTEWQGPLVVTDIDGVLDRMVFGFPLTSAAGIQALSLLHAHGFAVAVNTARTLEEVKAYCRAYGLAGGGAEYGAVVWDAVKDRPIVLAAPESLREVDRVRKAFQTIPGIFLDDNYMYSVRAYSLAGDRTTPIPALLAQDLLLRLGVEHLRIIHTGLDTAVLPKEVDKGKALLTMRCLLLSADAEVYAIGDSEPDLAMFKVADASFAPANVTCRREVHGLGTWISQREYQPGTLQIATRIVHPDGKSCERCQQVGSAWAEQQGLFVDLLRAADQTPLQSLTRNVSWHSALDFFRN
jgi:hydroxymethylpyrimidine pyrophosphatase-like HAD family hydrolase/orotate phosphoribosyltransferase